MSSDDYTTTSYMVTVLINSLQESVCLDGQMLSKDYSCLHLHSDSLLGHPGSDSDVPPWGASPHGHRVNNELFKATISYSSNLDVRRYFHK